MKLFQHMEAGTFKIIYPGLIALQLSQILQNLSFSDNLSIFETQYCWDEYLLKSSFNDYLILFLWSFQLMKN